VLTRLSLYSKKALRKIAEELRSEREKESATEMQKSLTELDSYLKSELEAEVAHPEPVAQEEHAKHVEKPEVIDFSMISATPIDSGGVSSTKEENEDQGFLSSMPMRAHKIPTQYLKKMSSAWKPPEFAAVDEKYYLIKPYAMANLKWSQQKNRLEYYLLEPFLTEEQKEQIHKLKTETEAVINALEGLSFMAPQGEITIDPKSHHAAVRCLITESTTDPNNFKILADKGIIPPIPPKPCDANKYR